MTVLWLLLLLSMAAVGLGAEGGTSEGGSTQTNKEDAIEEENENEEEEVIENEEQMVENKLDPNIPLFSQCCMNDVVMPMFFPNGVDMCTNFTSSSHGIANKRVPGGEGVDKEKVYGGKSGAGDEKSEDESECLFECILKANSMLDESKSIKEVELRRVLLNGVDEDDAKTTINVALDKCFALNKGKDEREQEKGEKEREKSSTCDRIQELFNCITKDVLENCPVQFWRTDIQQCRENLPKKAEGAAAKDNTDLGADI